MKIYIAGPIRGLPDLNKSAFDRYTAQLRADGHEVFNPIEKALESNLTIEHNESLPFRRAVFEEDLVWICREAEAVALIPGWENSKGAKAERAVARAIGLQVIYLG